MIAASELEAYTVNFHGRVTKASNNNFKLVHPDDREWPSWTNDMPCCNLYNFLWVLGRWTELYMYVYTHACELVNK